MPISTCYFCTEGIVLPPANAIPCGPPSSTGFVQCCVIGDTCGADGFCHYTHPLAGGSGYYLGGCTDEAFKDPSCSTQCTNHITGDAVFSQSTNLWSCCWDNVKGLNCSSPTNTTFEAPNPEVLFAVPFSILTASTSGSSTSSQSSTSTQGATTSILSPRTSTAQTTGSLQNVTAAPTETSLVDSSSGLSIGEKAGIGVGIALVVFIGLGVLLVLRWRSSRNRRHHRQQQPIVPSGFIPYPTHEIETRQPWEAKSSERAAKMPNSSRSLTEQSYGGTD